MAARLSNLAYQQSLSATTNGAPPSAPPNPAFPPRSVSFDIRTPEELAAVNEFLITLGRDVSSGAHPSRHQHSQSVPHASMEESSFFDPANLAHLGLAGMPGVPAAPGPGSGASYHGESGFAPISEFSHHGPSYSNRSSGHSIQSVQFGLYPAHEIAGPHAPLPYAGQRVRAQRASATDERLLSMDASQSFPSYSHYLTPPLDFGPAVNPGASPLSSHSGMSTPPNGTPPHMPLTVAPESVAAFDYVRPGRAPPPVVQLGPADYRSKNMRTTNLLQSAGPSAAQSSSLGNRPEPMEPKLGMGAVHRGLPARLTPSSAASSVASSSSHASSKASNPLYPLLTSGDAELKLPPLSARFRSPSPALSSAASVSSREATVSPTLTSTTTEQRSPSPFSDSSTPSPMHSVTPTPSPPLQQQNRSQGQSQVAYPTLPPLSVLASDVGRLELDNSRAVSPEERRKHVALLRDLLVAINVEYRKRHGTPPPPHVHRQEERPLSRGIEREMRDVEMVAA